MEYWWKEYSLRYDDELAAFSRREASVNIDMTEQASGSIVLKVVWPVDGGGLELIVRYPNHFPYFRPAIAAPSISLRYHQAPYTGDLCLIPQWTGAWRPEDLVADYIFEQLPKVLDAGSSDDKDKVVDFEVHQAEPRSGYYNYAPETFLLVEGSWNINPSEKNGHLLIGVGGKGSHSPADMIRKGLRGAVLEVQNQSGHTIATLNDEIGSRYAGTTFKGQWVRLETAPNGRDENCFWEILQKEFPKVFDTIQKKASRNGEGLVGFIFPEEAKYRGAYSDGWVFLYYFGANKKGYPKTRIYLSRAERAGAEDIFGRVPELLPLRSKKIAFAGLGCIGAQSAIEFAKSGIGELRFLEGDSVSPGNSCRWPLGLPYYGMHKIRALSHFMSSNFPFTTLGPCFQNVLGNPYNGPDEMILLEQWLDGVDLIFDGSAEVGVQHLLSTVARIRKIPYVLIETRPGGWGGVVARIVPGASGCYYCLCHHFQDGALGKEGGFKIPHQKKEDFIQPQGCLSPTFTAASFDVEEVSLHGVRMAVSLLCSGSDDSYPYYQDDVGVLSLRDDSGMIPCFPRWESYSLKKHPLCDCDSRSS
jgi:molybdopterin/thiamine biosynthesis adenylyltransferase